jgi:hypothetical protein
MYCFVIFLHFLIAVAHGVKILSLRLVSLLTGCPFASGDVFEGFAVSFLLHRSIFSLRLGFLLNELSLKQPVSSLRLLYLHAVAHQLMFFCLNTFCCLLDLYLCGLLVSVLLVLLG